MYILIILLLFISATILLVLGKRNHKFKTLAGILFTIAIVSSVILLLAIGSML